MFFLNVFILFVYEYGTIILRNEFSNMNFEAYESETTRTFRREFLMNTDYLRYFMTLAKFQHYGKAAKALNISQPGLSHAIRSLEEHFGLPLFEKTGRNVTLSPYGQELQKRVSVILNGLDDLEKVISDFHREDKVIQIASVYPLASNFIPELIASCPVKFPFAIYNGMTPDILHGLENMTYDLGFCSAKPSSELFEYCPVWKSYIGVIVPKNHELTQKEYFSMNDITAYPQIFFTKTSPMRALQEHIYNKNQLPVIPSCEAEEIEVILNMIEHGFGISVLPYLDIFKNRNIEVLPLTDANWESTFYAIRRKDRLQNNAEKAIWECIHSSFSCI